MTLIFVVFGVFSNTLSFCVFATPTLRGEGGSLFIMAMSVADTIVLLTYAVPEWLDHGLPVLIGPCTPWNPINFHIFTCRFIKLVSCASQFISAYLVVAFTYQRLYVVYRPLATWKEPKQKIPAILISAVVLVGFLVSLWKPILSGLYKFEGIADADELCTRNPDFESEYFVLEVLFAFVTMGLPFVLLVIGNSFLIYKLRQRKRSMNSMSQSSVSGNATDKDRKMVYQFAVIFAYLSVIFSATNLPYFIAYTRVYAAASDPDLLPDDVTERIAHKRTLHALFYSNYSINIFIYCFRCSNFRNVLRSWFSRTEEVPPATPGTPGTTRYSSVPSGSSAPPNQMELSAGSKTS